MADENTKVQGEGDRESAKRYNDDTKDFVNSGKAGQQPADLSEAEKRDLERAEEAGKSHAKR